MSLQVAMTVGAPAAKGCPPFSLAVEMTVSPGEIVGLLGPSGSGKSMTLKSIAGIMEPERGSIILYGNVLYDSSTHRNVPTRERRVGYLFQSYALFPHMTILQNVMSGIARDRAESYGQWKKRAHQIAMEYLSMVKMDAFAPQNPLRVSGGQQQRVAIARLLASQPLAILLDEPFSSLDNELKDAIDADLKPALLSAHCPVVFVSHNQEEVKRYCSRTICIGEGALGNPYAEPRCTP
ncbi:ABC-type sulfate/molybdate transport systems, ATPase component [Sphaerochaeta pleomorpha str. Grapes]|uniref:ABC-type sulfate/molybdate transport systems, ATPase component n=1 Tax=Sphaerochaeta pleomorpha (strain ATCC BAA-1885 / DSM 22778 / Grapes) TaxID=158190 RepID=G8QTB5_SPHPG|nr:ATP-binding cassette domain-containing protein [Sphaerochaeta pleomorpha]AEV29082.1 ABC-type sulfate/molybdate transport systems, ATPase component [Sphaerochaeta pleomorpha str. Grapes]